jgi:hypothetical protein
MNPIRASRDDQGLIGHHARRMRAGLIPKTGPLRQFPPPDADDRFETARPAPMTLHHAPVRRITGTAWRGPERRGQRVPVLLDTRARAGRSIDLRA